MNQLELSEIIVSTLNSKQIRMFCPPSIEYENLKKLDISLLKTLYLYSLSEGEEVFDDIEYFINISKNSEINLENCLTDPRIERIYKKAKQVRREIHRIKGFLRFKEIGGCYLYGPIQPDFNIIMPLSVYFSNRLRNEKILIHDTKRRVVTFCHKGKIYLAKIESRLPDLTSEEQEISYLWRKYFDKISIKERFNKKIQRQKVPLKYRSTMTEFMEKIE
jgi:probable DNA metabolism protein